MTRNTLGDMHNLLMEELERLATADSEEVDKEVKRAHAMANMATAINNNAATIIKAAQARNHASMQLPHILTPGDDQ